MDYTELDLNNVCRTCKNKSPQMKFLYYRDWEGGKGEPRLDEMLMACASVQVNNEDGLPRSICRSCILQLKNAYSFKKQCEKIDLFFRNYLKNLKKESVKEEIITDFTSNFIDEINSTLNDIGHINDDETIENIIDEPESQDVDYVPIVGSNVTIYECQTCSKIFYTLEALGCHKRIHTDNNKEHCLATEFDGNTPTFSNQSDDASGGDDLLVDEESVKPEKVVVDSGYECESDGLLTASRHAEYISTKQTNRARGRPPLLELKPKSSKNEIGNFPCPQCKEVFSKRILLERHAEQHDGLRIHECDTCNKKFRKWKILRRHKLSHLKVKPYLCVPCGKRFKRSDYLQKHMRSHSTTELQSCDLCHMIFNGAENLAKHKFSMHNIGEKITEDKKYKCQCCQKGFTTEKYRDSHMKIHYGDRKFKCGTCEKTFISKWHLTMHMKFHDDSSKKFLCSECGQRFMRNRDLVNHLMRHRGEKPFECKFCGKGFTCMRELTVHQRYHTGEKTHLCGICGKGFGGTSQLTVHTRTHTGEKPYRCTYCDAAFSQDYDMKTHVRRHTGERFQCELCPKTFIMRYLLTQHKRVVHGLNVVSKIRRLQPINKLNLDDPPSVTVSDPLQPKQIDVSDLKQEEKGDIMSYKLMVHTRTQTGERSYRCTYCDAAFTKSYDLKAHIRRHTGERFQCELCPKTFLMDPLLKQHKRVVHGVKIVSNRRRVQPINKLNPDDPPPVAVSDPLQPQQIDVSDLIQEEKSDII